MNHKPWVSLADDVFQRIPFRPNKKEPIDRWLQLPMGWDTSFVNWIAYTFAPPSISLVMDPYSGAGATLVWAHRSGHPAVGIDRDATAVIASYAKTHYLEAFDLRRGIDKFKTLARTSSMHISIADYIGFLSSGSYSVATKAVLTLPFLASKTPDGYLVPRMLHVMETISSDAAEFIASGLIWALWGSCDAVLAKVHAGLPKDRPWLVLGSPPHPRSRGGLGAASAELEIYLRGLAADINATQDVGMFDSQSRPNSTVDSVEGLLRLLGSISPHGTVVVLEYEIAAEGALWPELTLEAARSYDFADSGRAVLYSSAPDGRPGVVEGGVLVLRR